MASRMWHVQREQTVYGPVSEQKLRELANSGFVTPTMRVWCEELSFWIEAGRIQNLFDNDHDSSKPLSLERDPDARDTICCLQDTSGAALALWVCLCALAGGSLLFAGWCLRGENFAGVATAAVVLIGSLTAYGIFNDYWSRRPVGLTVDRQRIVDFRGNGVQEYDPKRVTSMDMESRSTNGSVEKFKVTLGYSDANGQTRTVVLKLTGLDKRPEAIHAVLQSVCGFKGG